MAKRSSFVDYVLESLEPLGDIRARAMFGAHALSLDGRNFALIDEDRLFLKVDEGTRPLYENEKCLPFSYEAKGELRLIRSYYEVPASALDNADRLCHWGRLAVEVAMKKPERRKRRKTE